MGKGTGQIGFEDESDPFENDLDEALCVFKSGDGNTDILEKNENLIMFYVDLENETIVNKVGSGEENKQDQNEDVSDSKHPVLFNQYPISPNHSLLLLFADAGLPQVLSDEILVLALQLFKLSDNESLRLGYNSMGADCIANNLHFHLLYADTVNNGINMFPIEQASKKLFFRTNLKHKNKEEINMYNCPVRFGELTDWPLKTIILSPDLDGAAEGEEPSLEDAQEALSHTAGILLNYLIDQNIPHNILIADEGMTLYVIPRKFDLLIENVQFFTSFETLCGFVKFKTNDAYEAADFASITSELQNNVSLGDADFDRMK